MLPDFLQSSLKIYKEDTNTIATWLAVKAKQFGYPADLLDHTDEKFSSSSSQSSQPSIRLKGKARKQAKDAQKEQGKLSEIPANSSDTLERPYIIKVKDFTTLAEYVAGSKKPVVKVPKDLVAALNRAIELRGQHNVWSLGQDGSDEPTVKADANKSHSYFLGILERTREILKPRMPSDMIDDFLSKPNGNSQRQTTSKISTKLAISRSKSYLKHSLTPQT